MGRRLPPLRVGGDPVRHVSCGGGPARTLSPRCRQRLVRRPAPAGPAPPAGHAVDRRVLRRARGQHQPRRRAGERNLVSRAEAATAEIVLATRTGSTTRSTPTAPTSTAAAPASGPASSWPCSPRCSPPPVRPPGSLHTGTVDTWAGAVDPRTRRNGACGSCHRTTPRSSPASTGASSPTSAPATRPTPASLASSRTTATRGPPASTRVHGHPRRHDPRSVGVGAHRPRRRRRDRLRLPRPRRDPAVPRPHDVGDHSPPRPSPSAAAPRRAGYDIVTTPRSTRRAWPSPTPCPPPAPGARPSPLPVDRVDHPLRRTRLQAHRPRPRRRRPSRRLGDLHCSASGPSPGPGSLPSTLTPRFDPDRMGRRARHARPRHRPGPGAVDPAGRRTSPTTPTGRIFGIAHQFSRTSLDDDVGPRLRRPLQPRHALGRAPLRPARQPATSTDRSTAWPTRPSSPAKKPSPPTSTATSWARPSPASPAPRPAPVGSPRPSSTSCRRSTPQPGRIDFWNWHRLVRRHPGTELGCGERTRPLAIRVSECEHEHARRRQHRAGRSRSNVAARSSSSLRPRLTLPAERCEIGTAQCLALRGQRSTGSCVRDDERRSPGKSIVRQFRTACAWHGAGSPTSTGPGSSSPSPRSAM
jgi:hypothetical protein